jgi:hypothetical protein
MANLKNCLRHTDYKLDRICNSITCPRPEKFICTECRDDHIGQFIKVEELIKNIKNKA